MNWGNADSAYVLINRIVCSFVPLGRANVIPLHELACRQSAIIQSIDGFDQITQRLFELGLLEGDLVEMIAVAPFGDPLEISSRHGCLSLRRSEAARILVEPMPEENSSLQQQKE